MTKKNLNDLEGWGLIWALAVYAGEKEIIPVGATQFGYLTGEMVVVKKGKNGERDQRSHGVHIYTPEDHKRLLSKFDLEPLETDDGMFHYTVDNVGVVEGDHKSEVKARAIIANRVRCIEVDFPS
ncbi:hypothetical protein [Pseudomonas atacamensis]|uniref:Uncharacterized protein n=1 Tax=Pseudomonas iranensis TaxID=2745503 RepID=A0AAU7F3V7_9PSED